MCVRDAIRASRDGDTESRVGEEACRPQGERVGETEGEVTAVDTNDTGAVIVDAVVDGGDGDSDVGVGSGCDSSWRRWQSSSC